MAVAIGGAGIVVSDGALTEDSGGAVNVRRVGRQDVPKFRVLQNDLVITGTGDGPMTDGFVYARAEAFVRTCDEATALSDLSAYLTDNLPAWHRECQARVRSDPRYDTIAFDGAAVMLIGLDRVEGRTRLFRWVAPQYELVEALPGFVGAPVALATGVCADDERFEKNLAAALVIIPTPVLESGLKGSSNTNQNATKAWAG